MWLRVKGPSCLSWTLFLAVGNSENSCVSFSHELDGEMDVFTSCVTSGDSAVWLIHREDQWASSLVLVKVLSQSNGEESLFFLKYFLSCQSPVPGTYQTLMEIVPFFKGNCLVLYMERPMQTQTGQIVKARLVVKIQKYFYTTW